MSRTFPYHAVPKRSRPIDAFTKDVTVPRIFDYEVNRDWHQLTLYNPNLDSTRSDPNHMEVSLGKSLNEGGLGLDTRTDYDFYDFWNDTLIGLIKGGAVLKQQLRTGETRMISIHAEEKIPQFLSTNRHIMQGYVDMAKYPLWDESKKFLSGVSKVVGGETYKIVFALSGYKVAAAKARGATATVQVTDQKNGLVVLSIDNAENAEVEWTVYFK
jgi:hypothetical protein